MLPDSKLSRGSKMEPSVAIANEIISQMHILEEITCNDNPVTVSNLEGVNSK